MSTSRHPEPKGGQCLCALCDEMFTSLTSFDLHQRMVKGRVVCIDPARSRKFVMYRTGWGQSSAEHPQNAITARISGTFRA